MSEDTFTFLKQLSDAELMTRVKDLVARERGATALLIAHLAELDTRDVLLREGYGSLFAYCREALGLSEHETFNRIEAARAARRFPVVVEMLAAGEVNLTAVRLLAPHLTGDNHRRVLAEARGKRTEQIREMVAALAPRPDTTSSVRKVAPARPAINPPTLAASGEPQGPASVSPAPMPTPASLTRPSVPAATVLPLAPDRYKLQLTIAGETLDKLRLAKEMLRHAVPSGDEAVIIDRALSALLTDLARTKLAATDRPRAPRRSKPGSRDVPAEVQRAVWVRDLGRCAFVGSSGHRCSERGFVEFHHVRPYAVGGEATLENIQLRCGRHNRYEARVYFLRDGSGGEGFVSEVRPRYDVASSPPPANSF